MDEKLTVGAVWHDAIAVVQRHFASFAVIAAVTIWLPSLVMRLLFPQAFDMAAFGKTPPHLPAGYWLLLAVAIMGQLIGTFSIAAVAADPDEGGGAELGAILGGAVPAMVKGVLAGLVFFAAYVAAIIVLGIIAFVGILVIGLATGFHSGAPDGNATTKLVIIGAVFVAVLVPLLTWVGARLSPLTGVYLRESVGVIEGIKRAWAMSNGSAWMIVKLLLIVGLLAFGLSAFQLGLARMGYGSGVGGFVFGGIVMGGLGALLLVYEAAGLGIVYRRLVEREG